MLGALPTGKKNIQTLPGKRNQRFLKQKKRCRHRLLYYCFVFLFILKRMSGLPSFVTGIGLGLYVLLALYLLSGVPSFFVWANVMVNAIIAMANKVRNFFIIILCLILTKLIIWW